MPWDVIFNVFLVRSIQYVSLYASGGCTDTHPQWDSTAQDQAVFWSPWSPKHSDTVLEVCVRQEEVKLGQPHPAVTWVSFQPSPVLIKSKTVQHSIHRSNHWFSLFPLPCPLQLAQNSTISGHCEVLCSSPAEATAWRTWNEQLTHTSRSYSLFSWFISCISSRGQSNKIVGHSPSGCKYVVFPTHIWC